MNEPAIRENRRAGDVFGLIEGQENEGRDWIFGFADAAPRDVFLPVFRLADVGNRVACH